MSGFELNSELQCDKKPTENWHEVQEKLVADQSQSDWKIVSEEDVSAVGHMLFPFHLEHLLGENILLD